MSRHNNAGYLVFTRMDGEGIRIGDDIRVMVHSVHRSRVTLAVDAPRDVQVSRGTDPRVPGGYQPAPPPEPVEAAEPGPVIRYRKRRRRRE